MTKQAAEQFKELGNEQYKKGAYAKAIDYYSEAIDANNEEPSYFTNRSACYLQLKQYDKAVDDAKRATSIDSSFLKGYWRAAQALTMLGKLTEADRACRKALELSPQNREISKEKEKIARISAFVEKGKERLASGNNEEALVEFENALQLAPQSIQFKLFKCEALLGQKQFKEVMDITEQIIKEEDSNNAEAFFARARALYYTGNSLSASSMLKQALSLQPDFEKATQFSKRIRRQEAAKEEGNAAFKSGDYEKALSKYQETIQMDPLNSAFVAQLYTNKAATFMKMGKYAEAQKEATNAIEADPKYTKAYLRRCESNLKLENIEDAARDIGQAHELEPSNKDLEIKLKEVNKILKLSKKRDFYKILGVERNADNDQIKKAYKDMCKKWHPDRFQDEEEKKKAEAMFKDISEANNVLSDPQKRRMHDMGADDPDSFGNGSGGVHMDMGGMDMGNIFQMFMGGMGGQGGMGGFPGGFQFSMGGEDEDASGFSPFGGASRGGRTCRGGRRFNFQ